MTDQRIGPFEILAKLGEGGMGQVYRARDTKLGREVAIKLLPEAVAEDPERVTRFEREAKALAALNHPRIATLFGMEHIGGRHLLIMEVVEGPTLAEHIATRVSVPVDEALGIAIQIAEALEAAHERGIVHRDLKPANIKVGGEPLSVKVLDFGLARAGSTGSAGSGGLAGAMANSPTMTSLGMTQAGVILGTAAYMSPEQAKGQPTDHRSDIFSFGSVLFELISGRHVFEGENASEVLASVIKTEPEWSRLPSDLHPRLIELLKRCLAKSRRDRYQAIGDVRIELETIRQHPTVSLTTQALPVASHRATPVWRRVAAAAALLLSGAAGATAFLLTRESAPAPSVIRFTVALREGEVVSSPNRRQIALSPDSSQLAFVVNQRLYVRRVDGLEAQPVTDTLAGIASPTYSPDGKWIAFIQSISQNLMRVASSGGAVAVIASALNEASPMDLEWSPHGFFYTSSRGIMHLEEQGGTPTLVAKAENDEVFGSISVVNNDAFLVTSTRSLPANNFATAFDRAQILVVERSGQRRVLLEPGTGARYLSTGHVVFVRQGVLYAIPFDAKGLTVTGTPVPVVDGVTRAQALGQFSVSRTGALAYSPGSSGGSSTSWQPGVFGRTLEELLRLPSGQYVQLIASPDAKTVAAWSDSGAESAIWLYDLTGASSARRLTLGAVARFPIWTADGKRVTYQREAATGSGLFVQRADGSDAPEQLTTSTPGITHIPYAWLPDGQLLFDEINGQQATLSIYSPRDRRATPIPNAVSNTATSASLSPDGRWIAFALRSSGARSTVFVEPYPTTGARYQISQSGLEDGHHPVWSRDGRALIYNPGPGQALKQVEIKTEPSFILGAVTDLPTPFIQQSPLAPRPFDVLPKGRFVGFELPGGRNPQVTQMVVVLNWFEELKQKVR